MLRSTRIRAGLAGLVLAFPLSGNASTDPAEAPPVPVLTAPSAAAAIEARERRRVCVGPGCAGAPGQPWAHAAAFGAAAFAAAWIGRRRHAHGP